MQTSDYAMFDADLMLMCLPTEIKCWQLLAVICCDVIDRHSPKLADRAPGQEVGLLSKPSAPSAKVCARQCLVSQICQIDMTAYNHSVFVEQNHFLAISGCQGHLALNSSSAPDGLAPDVFANREQTLQLLA